MIADLVLTGGSVFAAGAEAVAVIEGVDAAAADGVADSVVPAAAGLSMTCSPQ